MYHAGLDPVSLINQLAYNINNAYKPNPKTGELYFDADSSTKSIQVALKATKFLEKEPEIVQPVYINYNWKAW